MIEFDSRKIKERRKVDYYVENDRRKLIDRRGQDFLNSRKKAYDKILRSFNSQQL